MRERVKGMKKLEGMFGSEKENLGLAGEGIERMELGGKKRKKN